MNKINNHICECCGKEHDGSYGSGRFCSKFCSHSRKISSIIKEKIKQGTKNAWQNLQFKCKFCNRRFKNENTWKEHEQKCTPENRKRINNSPIYREKFLKRYFERKINVHGTILDVTQAEIDDYRKTHDSCEICGKSIIDLNKNLAIDHDHSTSKFRGLLCMNCNANLGWFEKYKDEITNYLISHTK